MRPLFTLSFALLLSACSGGGDKATQPAVEQALNSGDVSLIENSEVIFKASQSDINASVDSLTQIQNQLFNLNGDGQALTDIQWNPTHDAAQLSATFGSNDSILVSDEGDTLAVIGEQDKGRYLVMGSNPFRSRNSSNEQMSSFMQNSIAWLTGKAVGDLNQVVIAHMDESQYFKDESGTRTWLDTHYQNVSYNSDNTCDDSALAACLAQTPDLLIISQVAAQEHDIDNIVAQIKKANQQGIPVLYMHWDGGLTSLGRELLSLFNVNYVKDNYWDESKLSAFNGANSVGQLPVDIEKIQTMLSFLQSGNYSFTLADCEANCSNFSQYQDEFKQGVDVARTMINTLDTQKIAIFESEQYRLHKQLVLLADYYRQGIQFPMDKATTNQHEFLKAYFADHIIYNTRNINPVQTDMGNFSRSDFSHITPTNKTVELTSKRNFRAAGVYALPGQTFSVTRTDASEVVTHIFINTQRSGSTHEWDKDSYSRPKFLQSQKIEIKPGETISMTNPYGGPIQINFNTNDLPVNFNFKHIGTHPYWNKSEHNDAFDEALATGDYDWAEVSTPGFEVHSSLNKMRESMANEHWGNAAELANATMRYVHNFPHVLAGFQGPSIDKIDEIHDFAQNNSWTIDTIDMVKHMNADQATCGYGCSGNPYDAYWNFSPVGHGDIHELGHGLERGRFRFAGWEGHASTNPYSYYTKTQFYKTTGNEPSCQNLPFDDLLSTLQTSLGEADASAYMQAQNLTGWSQGMAMYVQIMMAAQAQGALVDGWHVLARLHMLDREFNRADNSEETWLDKRDSLGFGHFTSDEAKALSNNDWLTIGISYVTQLDYREFLTMWGLPASAQANNQVASFSFAKAQTKFYQASGNDFCYGLDKPALDVVDSNGDGFIDGNEPDPS